MNVPRPTPESFDPRLIDRRQFIGRGLAIGGAAAFSPIFLAACSDDKKAGTASGSGPGGSFKLGTWVFYIDADDANPQESPTIKAFTKQTGTKVDYTVDVNGNVEFTSKLQPTLEKGQPTGYDLVVLTSWMTERWIRKGWAETLDDSKLPNKKNMLARHQNPAWDPNRAHTMPFAEGQVGIAYYPDEVGFEIKDVKDLLNPKLKGKVTVLDEMRDTLGMFMLSDGLDPSTASVDDAKKSLATIAKARDAGQFRKVTGNDYTDDLGSKGAIASIAWSGDVVGLQADHPELKWVAPAAGQMSFVDTMVIPKAAVNSAQAHAWMNYLYDPTVSGPLFEAISYVSPVKGAVDNMSDEAKKNTLINPLPSSKIVDFKILTETEADELENAFVQATQL